MACLGDLAVHNQAVKQQQDPPTDRWGKFLKLQQQSPSVKLCQAFGCRDVVKQLSPSGKQSRYCSVECWDSMAPMIPRPCECRWCRSQSHYETRMKSYSVMLSIALELGDPQEIRILEACGCDQPLPPLKVADKVSTQSHSAKRRRVA